MADPSTMEFVYTKVEHLLLEHTQSFSISTNTRARVTTCTSGDFAFSVPLLVMVIPNGQLIMVPSLTFLGIFHYFLIYLRNLPYLLLC